MSHRQSCNRCRQQKVRCLRDENQTGNPASLPRCERCMKAGVPCVYSVNSITAKRRSNRHSSQAPIQTGTGTELGHLGSSWLDSGITGGLYTSGSSLGADFSDLVHQFSSLDESGPIAGFSCWDANLQPFSPTALGTLSAPSMADETLIPTAPSTADGHDDNEDIQDDKDPTDALSSQLVNLSQRAARATFHLIRPDNEPLTVSSPEVSEALEITNTLIHMMENITARGRNSTTLDATTTDHGLVFSALACHQHLVALFQSICDAIHRSIQSKEQQLHQSRRHSDIGPSSIAQFVMVLQLLMHLVNRMDRGLFQINSSGYDVPTGDCTTPASLDPPNRHILDLTQLGETIEVSSSSGGGLINLVQNIVVAIPNKNVGLRKVIQKLQIEIEQTVIY